MPHLGAAYAGCLILLQLPADGLLLTADEIGINAGFVYQTFVLALLHDASVVDNKYLIRMAHGFQPVGDHDDGLVARERLDSLLQSVLILRVTRITIGASLSMARAIEMRWRSPPERLAPPSPMTVL